MSNLRFRKFNHNHAEAGQSNGGQFAAGDGSSSGETTPTKPRGQGMGAAGAGSGAPQQFARPARPAKRTPLPDEGKWHKNPKGTVFGRVMSAAAAQPRIDYGGLAGGAIGSILGAVGGGTLGAATTFGLGGAAGGFAGSLAGDYAGRKAGQFLQEHVFGIKTPTQSLTTGLAGSAGAVAGEQGGLRALNVLAAGLGGTKLRIASSIVGTALGELNGTKFGHYIENQVGDIAGGAVHQLGLPLVVGGAAAVTGAAAGAARLSRKIRKDGEGAAAPSGPTMESAHVPGPLAMTRRPSLVHAAPGKRQLKAGGRKRRAAVLGRSALYAKAGPANEARDDHGRWTGQGTATFSGGRTQRFAVRARGGVTSPLSFAGRIAQHFRDHKEKYLAAAYVTLMAAAILGVHHLNDRMVRAAAEAQARRRKAYSDAFWQHFKDAHGRGGWKDRYTPSSSSSGMSLVEAHRALGVKPGASAEEIHRAYRNAMRTAHPDAGGSVAAAQHLNAAKDALKAVRKADITKFAKYNEDEPRDEHGRWTAIGTSVGGRVGATLGGIAGATIGYHLPANVREAGARALGGVKGAALGALVGATLRGKPVGGARYGGRIGSQLGVAIGANRVSFAVAGAGLGATAGRSYGEHVGARIGRRIATLRKYSADEARDERGRWTSAGGVSETADRIYRPDAVAQHVGTLTSALGAAGGGIAGEALGGPAGPLLALGTSYIGATVARSFGERFTSAVRANSGEDFKNAILGTRVDPDDDHAGVFEDAASAALGGQLGRRALAFGVTHGINLGARHLAGKAGASIGGVKARIISEVLGAAAGEYGAKIVRHFLGKRFDFTPTIIRKFGPINEPRDDHGRWSGGGGPADDVMASRIHNAALDHATKHKLGFEGYQATARSTLDRLPEHRRASVGERLSHLAEGVRGSQAAPQDSIMGRLVAHVRRNKGAYLAGLAVAAAGTAFAIGHHNRAALARAAAGRVAAASASRKTPMGEPRRGPKLPDGQVGTIGQQLGRRGRRPIGKSAWTVGCKIVKSANPKGLVYGWASVIEKNGNVITDHQGDRIHSDELVKAAHDYVTSSRAGKLMHKGKDVGHIVESVVFTHELQKALGVDLGKVGWLIGYQITDPAAKAEFQKGKFRAFSIGGSGIREDV